MEEQQLYTYHVHGMQWVVYKHSLDGYTEIDSKWSSEYEAKMHCLMLNNQYKDEYERMKSEAKENRELFEQLLKSEDKKDKFTNSTTFELIKIILMISVMILIVVFLVSRSKLF